MYRLDRITRRHAKRQRIIVGQRSTCAGPVGEHEDMPYTSYACSTSLCSRPVPPLVIGHVENSRRPLRCNCVCAVAHYSGGHAKRGDAGLIPMHCPVVRSHQPRGARPKMGQSACHSMVAMGRPHRSPRSEGRDSPPHSCATLARFPVPRGNTRHALEGQRSGPQPPRNPPRGTTVDTMGRPNTVSVQRPERDMHSMAVRSPGQRYLACHGIGLRQKLTRTRRRPEGVPLGRLMIGETVIRADLSAMLCSTWQQACTHTHTHTAVGEGKSQHVHTCIPPHLLAYMHA